MAKKRRSSGKEEGAASAGPAKKVKKWKPVEMGFDMMKEFEHEGGLFIEEADDDFVGITYGDGSTGVAGTGGKRGKKHEDAAWEEDAVWEEDAAWEPDAAQDWQAPEGQARGGKKKKKKKREGRQPEAEAPVEEKGSAAEGEPQSEAPLEKAGGMVPVDGALADLPAWAQFDLHPILLAGLAKLGFRTPTPVQARCLSPALQQRKDIVGAAETGSGKTLAFGLPILHHTICAIEAAGEEPAVGPERPATSSASQQLRALAVLPTRELAVQVQGHINAAAAGTVVHAACVVGGMSLEKQQRLLRRQPQIVVGTPGRLFALMGLGKEADKERCDWFREGLRGLRHLVLDEADRLVESGHFHELDRILNLVYESVERAPQLQTFVFSATLTLDPRSDRHRMRDGEDDTGKLGALMRRLRFREVRAVHLVDLTKLERDVDAGMTAGQEVEDVRGAKLPEQLSFREVMCNEDRDKDAFLSTWLLLKYRWPELRTEYGGLDAESNSSSAVAPGGQVVLFVNAISSVLRLSSVLAMMLESPSADKVLSRVRMSRSDGGGKKPSLVVDVIGLHSRMRQKERLKRMERFRSLKHAVLVCTDIAARGLDVPDIAAVLHYHVPRSSEIFVHRSGRTARAGRKGESVALVAPSDATQWTRIHRATGISRQRVTQVCPTSHEINAGREAARLAADLESKLHRTSKARHDLSWMQRAADEAELMLSEDEQDKDAGPSADPRRQLWGLYQQMLQRVRRAPRRLGAGPLPRRARGR